MLKRLLILFVLIISPYAKADWYAITEREGLLEIFRDGGPDGPIVGILPIKGPREFVPWREFWIVKAESDGFYHIESLGSETWEKLDLRWNNGLIETSFRAFDPSTKRFQLFKNKKRKEWRVFNRSFEIKYMPTGVVLFKSK